MLLVAFWRGLVLESKLAVARDVGCFRCGTFYGQTSCFLCSTFYGQTSAVLIAVRSMERLQLFSLRYVLWTDFSYFVCGTFYGKTSAVFVAVRSMDRLQLFSLRYVQHCVYSPLHRQSYIPEDPWQQFISAFSTHLRARIHFSFLRNSSTCIFENSFVYRHFVYQEVFEDIQV
jgi:hypothetical protein